MNKLIDRLYIGTGPIHIADAFFHAETKHEKVMMIDRHSEIGGAWVAIKVGNYGQLEIGCHIWSYNKKVYRFLNEFLDLDLIKMNPQPYLQKGKTKIKYDHKNALRTTRETLMRLKKLDFKSLKIYLLENPSSRFPIISRPYLYPRGGAREFQDKLIQKIQETAVEIELNKEVSVAEFKNDVWNISHSNGDSIQSRELCLTASSALKKIIFKGEEYPIEYKTIDFSHYHIVFEGELAKKISYIRVLNHPLIHRISDITFQLDNQSGKELSVLLVGVIPDELARYDKETEVIAAISEFLLANSIINDKNKFQFSQKNSFKTAYIPEDVRDNINALHPSIELAGTSDIIYGFRRQMRKWKNENFI